MERLSKLNIAAPIIKINNRALNLDFYESNLGFKVWNEENAFADLGAAGQAEVKLILEEAPSMRHRKVSGKKKLQQMVVRVAEPEEITALLARGSNYETLYQGKNGWAFIAVSPEGDRYLLHSEDDWTQLKPSESPQVFETTLSNFVGLTQFEIERLILNTAVIEESLAFYQSLFNDVTVLTFDKAEGQDLQVLSGETWDLVGFEVKLPASLTIAALAKHLETQNQSFFVDKKSTFLVLQDPNGLELTFRS